MQFAEAQAYRALSYVAERIGANNWARVPGPVKAKATRQAKRRGCPPSLCVVNWPSPAHRDVVQAMADLGRGVIDAEDAMALLWRSDVWAERFSSHALMRRETP